MLLFIVNKSKLRVSFRVFIKTAPHFLVDCKECFKKLINTALQKPEPYSPSQVVVNTKVCSKLDLMNVKRFIKCFANKKLKPDKYSKRSICVSSKEAHRLGLLSLCRVVCICACTRLVRGRVNRSPVGGAC